MRPQSTVLPPCVPTRKLTCSQSTRTLCDGGKRHTYRRPRLRRVHANTTRRVTKSPAHILYRGTFIPSLLSTLPNIPDTHAQNYISATTIRDIKVLRSEFRTALQSAGLVSSAPNADARKPEPEPELLKALLLAALYPRVARIALPQKAVKYTRVAGGAVEREVGAGEWRARDMRGERVWVHPASVQFAEARWRSGVVVSFRRVETTKLFLRDVTEVSLKLTHHTLPTFCLFVCLLMPPA